jgi:ATP-binding cassette subfamily B protein
MATVVTRRSMSSHASSDDEPRRLRAAIRLVVRRYVRRVRARPWLAAGSLVLPGVGNIFVHYLPALAIARLLALLAHDAQAGVGELATPVVLLAVAWLGGEAIWRLAGLAIYRNLEGSLTDAAQFTELLLHPPAIVDADPVEPFQPRDASVRFRSVRFAHPSRPPLFDGLDLTISAGEKVGLVGRSGGGKTTLTRLLLRFADLDAGAIEIGGQDIATIAQSALRSFIATVPQEPAMFHRTIAENIRIGRPRATDAEVRHAAELAHAAEFIAALPAGYDTLVGERGIKLSGGQRQRIAIARALLKDAPILVLDEATSALDSESENHIQQALWTLMQDRTAIVIAHRLSTVRRMDRLVVLEAGAIVEHGRHDQLLAGRGYYAALWQHQSGGFLQELAG